MLLPKDLLKAYFNFFDFKLFCANVTKCTEPKKNFFLVLPKLSKLPFEIRNNSELYQKEYSIYEFKSKFSV